MTRHCHHFARPQKQEALETINIGKAVASPDIQYAILPGDHGHGFTRVEQAAAIDLVKLRLLRLDISPTLVCHADNCERRFEAQFFGDLPGYRHVGDGPSAHTQIPRLKIGSANVCTPVTNAQRVCCLLLELKKLTTNH